MITRAPSQEHEAVLRTFNQDHLCAPTEPFSGDKAMKSPGCFPYSDVLLVVSGFAVAFPRLCTGEFHLWHGAE